MTDMKLTAEVLLRIEGHDELHSVGTIDVPISVTFGDKPSLGHKPVMRSAPTVNVTIDESNLGRHIEAATKHARGFAELNR